MPNDKFIPHCYKSGNKKGKIECYTNPDFNFCFWPYEEQTKIKHQVFEAYFKVWLIKLGAYGNKVNYYDGFSGCGAYFDVKTGEVHMGSPIIAKNTALNNDRDANCCLYLNDMKPENIKNITNVLNYNNLGNNNIFITQETFEINVNKFLDKVEKLNQPTFFMIDPYGINVSFGTLKRIMSMPRTEILFNFMYNYINRFLTLSKSANGINKLFGTDKWKNFINIQGSEKEDAVVSLFREQLKTFSKYVYQYRLSFPDIDKTYYYLFHLTNNRDGCSIMKDAFASKNMGNVEFLGPKQPTLGQLALFDTNELEMDSIKQSIFDKYKSQTIIVKNIIDDYIDSTPYLERQIISALKDMEDEYLKIKKNNKNARTPKHDDTIIFFDTPSKKTIIEQKTLF